MARNAELEQKYYARLSRAGEFLSSLEDGHGLTGLANGVIRDIRIRFGGEDGSDILLIVRAYDDRGKHIAFVGALNVVDCLLTWRKKDDSSGLKWREDVPWEERGG